jgi:MFS transporter, ACDE family, multidrug resistance protein
VAPGLGTLLAIRFGQGIVFGALLSMTVGIIGAVAPTGPAAHRGQSRRIVAMAAGETLFPVAGALMLPLGWYAPFGLQILALPLAIVAWFVLPDEVRPSRRDVKEGSAESVWRAPAVVGVQLLGAARFVFKFAVLTYLPVLAVDQVGMSATLLGQLIGVSGALSVVAALLSGRLASRLRSSEMIAACLAVIAVSLVLVGAAGSAIVVAIGLLLYGAQDGVYGVAHNVLANEMSPTGARMAYVGLTGTVRNAGKFLAPLMFGAVALVLPLSSTFFTFAGVSVAGAMVARNVARRQKAMETLSLAESDSGSE